MLTILCVYHSVLHCTSVQNTCCCPGAVGLAGPTIPYTFDYTYTCTCLYLHNHVYMYLNKEHTIDVVYDGEIHFLIASIPFQSLEKILHQCNKHNSDCTYMYITCIVTLFIHVHVRCTCSGILSIMG